MLYDKRWEKPQVKADPFSLESLIAWLEKQPAHFEYCYLLTGECLLARYFKDSGFQNVTMWTDGFWHGESACPGHIGLEEARLIDRVTKLPSGFNMIAQSGPHTFGGALKRARAALSAQQ